MSSSVNRAKLNVTAGLAYHFLVEHRWAKNEQPNDRDTVGDALVLGAYRRLYRDLNAPPLAPVRSLRYFGGLIEEILAMEVCPDGYFQYLRYRIKTFEQSK